MRLPRGVVALLLLFAAGQAQAAPKCALPPAALVSSESRQIGALAAPLCAGKRKGPAQTLHDGLQLVRLAPYAPPEAAALFAEVAAALAPADHLAAGALQAAAAWVRDQHVPLDEPPPAGPARWAWLGPFAAEHGTAFERAGDVESEAQRLPLAVGQAQWRGRDVAVAWQPLPTGMDRPQVRMALHELVDRPDDAIVYAQAWVRVAQPVQAQLRLGCEGGLKAWLGGTLVADLGEVPASDGLPGDLPPVPPQPIVSVQLGPQWQRLLIKLAPAGATLDFALALTDGHGVALPVELTPTLPAGGVAVRGAPPLAIAADPARPLGISWDPDKPPSADVAAALLQASWLGWRLPAAVAEVVIGWPEQDLPASPALAIAHANLPGEAGDRMQRLTAWQARLPHDLGLALALAQALGAVGRPGEAFGQCQQWQHQHQPATAASVAACLQAVRVQRAIGADRLANQTLAACLRRSGQRLLTSEVQRWNAAHRQPIAVGSADHKYASADAFNAALAHHLPCLAAQHEVALVRRFPGRTRLSEALIRAVLQATSGEALPADRRCATSDFTPLDRLGAIAPQQRRSQWHELMARATADRGAAITHLQMAAQLAPQRADLRTRLRLLTAGRDFYADYRRDLVALAQKERTVPRKKPMEVRLRQTVVRSLGNGQQARYEAEVYYIGRDGPGSHSLEIDYPPSLSEAEILQAVVIKADGKLDRQVDQHVERFSEDSSGMYFDLERLTLTFRNLKPGDSIAVEHEVRDLGPAPFGLVFGELLPLGDVLPVREVDIAILLPEQLPLSFVVHDPLQPAAPQQMPVKRTLDLPEGGKLRQWRWRLGPYPAAQSEESSPNPIERVAVLHASSFGNWDEAAQWYNQLLQEALPEPGKDTVLRELAQRLAQGKDTLQAKVRAVYDYARAQVRYVGLEFGIHSLQPHSAREVAQRQFGDCKDKAALIVALLAELDISAQVALVRTSDLGHLRDGVASLGLFNHAIAYVPGLDWWLDATAVPNGPLELPAGDAGGMALRIGPDADIEALPRSDPAAERNEVQINVVVHADGAADLLWLGSFAGLSAAEVRGHLQGATSQKERVEQDLAPRWPGIAVQSVQVTGVEPLLDTVTVRIAAKLANLGKRTGATLTLAPLRPAKSLVEVWTPDTDRQTPRVLPRPLHYAETLRFTLPPGAQPGPLPGQQHIAGPISDFEVQAVTDDTAVQWRVQWRVKVPVVATAHYALLKGWFAQLDAALKAEWTIELPTAEAPK